MKKLCHTLLFLLVATAVWAQDPTSYFMEGSTFRSQMNPAFAPLRGYVNIPILGGIQIGTGGNISLDKILYPVNGELTLLLNGSVPAAVALDGLKSKNSLSTSTSVNVIGFGAFARDHKTFWSFDLNLRADTDTRMPYELFDFLKTGNSTEIRDIGVSAEAYLEAAFTYSFPLTDKIYLGVRGKFLAGMARTRVNLDRFDASLGIDKWTAQAHGTMEMTGIGAETKILEDGTPAYDLGDFNFDKYTPSGYGFGIDVGVTYDVLPDLQLSASVNDLGAMFWNKGRTQYGRIDEEIEFTGVEITDDDVINPKLDLDDLEFKIADPSGKGTMLCTSFNVGAEYEVWRHKIGLGLLYHGKVYEYRTLHNLTASVNFHPARWVCLTGSYSFVDNRSGAVGLAVNLCPSWINFYLATDVLTGKKTRQWLPVKQSTMNVTFGIGIPIGKRSHRIAEYIDYSDRQ